MGSLLVGNRAVAVEPPGTAQDAQRRPLSEVRKEFERLVLLWEKERKEAGSASSIQASWAGPHGKAIIALGPAVVPFLIQRLKAGDFWFNVPLAQITQIDIVEGKAESEQATSKLWLAWCEFGGRSRSEARASGSTARIPDDEFMITFEPGHFQSREVLLEHWKRFPIEKRKEIVQFLFMRLGLSSTGGIRLIGVYQNRYVEDKRAQDKRILHFQQLDLFEGRLFWSVLVYPEESTARLLYHVNRPMVVNKRFGGGGPISILEEE